MALSKLSPPSPLLGNALVVGGCGFLGRNLVSALVKDPTCSRVFVLDRVTPAEPLPKVTYLKGSITDAPRVKQVLQEIRPQVIFHTASPNAVYSRLKNDFFETNVNGTKILLNAARESCVKAFVFTSSSEVYINPPHNFVDEDYPIHDENSNVEDYPKSKAIADSIVLAASTSDFRTVSLRLTHLYGDGDSQAIPVAMDACSGSKPLFRLGDGKNLFDVVSMENTIAAHIVAAKALINPSLTDGKVNGEAFNVSDGKPVLFWDFFVIVWSTARGYDVRKTLWVFPSQLVWFLVSLVEWIYFIFTLNMVKPRGIERMERVVIEYCLTSSTYDSDKLRKRLRFEPVLDFEGVLKRAVEWEMRKRKQDGKKTN